MCQHRAAKWNLSNVRMELDYIVMDGDFSTLGKHFNVG